VQSGELRESARDVLDEASYPGRTPSDLIDGIGWAPRKRHRGPGKGRSSGIAFRQVPFERHTPLRRCPLCGIDPPKKGQEAASKSSFWDRCRLRESSGSDAKSRLFNQQARICLAVEAAAPPRVGPEYCRLNAGCLPVGGPDRPDLPLSVPVDVRRMSSLERTTTGLRHAPLPAGWMPLACISNHYGCRLSGLPRSGLVLERKAT